MTKPRMPRAEIVSLARNGATNDQIAKALSVAGRTLCRDRAADPELNEAIKAARTEYAAENRVPCGTPTRYGAGCRCADCREAQRIRHYEWTLTRRARLGLPPPNPRRGRRAKPYGTRTPVLVLSLTEQVEQAIAAGHMVSRIMAEHSISYELYREIRDGLDQVVAS